MLKMEEKQDVEPMCPHCKDPLRSIWFRDLGGMFGKRYVYFCSQCRSVLGMSHRKGFWMG